MLRGMVGIRFQLGQDAAQNDEHRYTEPSTRIWLGPASLLSQISEARPGAPGMRRLSCGRVVGDPEREKQQQVLNQSYRTDEIRGPLWRCHYGSVVACDKLMRGL